MTPVEASDRRRVFCARLKSERERRGTSLATIAASTKIKASLLDALERGDLSRWPKGLYRRGFFREYANAIGLASAHTLTEFAELFADGEPQQVTPASAPPPSPETLRLLLAPASPLPLAGLPKTDVRSRVAFAAADVCLLLVFASMVSIVSPLAFTRAALLFGVMGYLLAALLGESPSLWLSTRVPRLRLVQKPRVTSSAFAPGPLPSPGEGGSSPVLSFSGRFADALVSGRALLHDCVERLATSELTAGPQRRRDLATLRRQRADAASHTTADELVM